MDQDLAQQAFEQIDNYILQLLLWSLAAQVVALVGAVAYLFRYFDRRYQEAIDRERQMTEALSDAAAGFENLRQEVREVRTLITDHLLPKK